MLFFLTTLHVMLCFSLILIILLQPGKDGAAVFGGGGGNQMYGPRGQANLLGRATTVVAAMFMFTSISLAYYSGIRNQGESDIKEEILRLEQEQADAAKDEILDLRQETPVPEPETTQQEDLFDPVEDAAPSGL